MVEATQEDSGEEMTYGEYLLQAAREGDLDAVKECLQEEVPIGHQDPESGNTALHFASANGKCDVIALLLEAGANINVQNKCLNTPLHWAALCGETKAVKLLCEHAKIDGKVTACNIKNEFGRIPYQEAL